MATSAKPSEIHTITAHDLFAAATLTAVINDKEIVRTGGRALLSDPHGVISKIAFNVADAMIAEREKRIAKAALRDR